LRPMLRADLFHGHYCRASHSSRPVSHSRPRLPGLPERTQSESQSEP
jgi:hypothetical protein